MATQFGKKGILTLILAFVAVFLLMRVCSGDSGSETSLPETGTESTDGSGGRLNRNDNSDDATVNGSDWEDMSGKELERSLGVGKSGGSATTTKTPSTTSSALSPLTFKQIPMSGTLSEFGEKLLEAGFRKTGSNTYTGDFVGFSDCRITPSGSNPVREVRVDFPVISDWDALEKAYDFLQKSLTEKYGIEPKVNGNVALFTLPNGTITLDADVKDSSSWHVIMKYANAVSTRERSAIDDL